MRFPIVIEESQTAYLAYSPDLPGCVAAARMQDEVERAVREAVEFHMENLPSDDIGAAELGAIPPSPGLMDGDR